MDQGGFEFLTVRQVAEGEGVSMSRVRRLASEGRFPGAFKVGRDWLLPVASVETWLRVDRDRRRKREEGG
jgi:excisionase family DNA binding protein